MVKDAGILFKQGDEKALAEIIKELAENKTYYNNTVKNCIMRAQKFEISKMIKNYIGLYKDVLEK
jgi:glycosyltransferase involved in cell wall biosynthesis